MKKEKGIIGFDPNYDETSLADGITDYRGLTKEEIEEHKKREELEKLETKINKKTQQLDEYDTKDSLTVESIGRKSDYDLLKQKGMMNIGQGGVKYLELIKELTPNEKEVLADKWKRKYKPTIGNETIEYENPEHKKYMEQYEEKTKNFENEYLKLPRDVQAGLAQKEFKINYPMTHKQIRKYVYDKAPEKTITKKRPIKEYFDWSLRKRNDN